MAMNVASGGLPVTPMGYVFNAVGNVVLNGGVATTIGTVTIPLTARIVKVYASWTSPGAANAINVYVTGFGTDTSYVSTIAGGTFVGHKTFLQLYPPTGAYYLPDDLAQTPGGEVITATAYTDTQIILKAVCINNLTLTNFKYCVYYTNDR
jgi:hypothetical protein